MTKSLQEISDRMEIDEVLVRYSRALDFKNFDEIEPLFTDDAEFDAGSLGKPQGPHAIRAMIQASLEKLDSTQHSLAKSLITFTDPDTAEVRTYLISQHILGEKHYFIGAEYADRLVRTPQGWRIAYRRLDRMWKEGDRSVITRSH
ncbi:MAG: nuclear transport factor 2 family protein [Actinomycetes bacterium]|jgi:3-phenylpropionate/cinnamic acid dioxygenase small subunit